MPVSLAGLDMPWLNDPEKRLPPRPKVKKWRAPNKRSDTVAAPYFMADAKPYINVSTRDTLEITSRSQQREFEKRTGYVQVGNDIPPGSIAAENNAKKARWDELSGKGHTTQPEWVV